MSHLNRLTDMCINPQTHNVTDNCFGQAQGQGLCKNCHFILLLSYVTSFSASQMLCMCVFVCFPTIVYRLAKALCEVLMEWVNTVVFRGVRWMLPVMTLRTHNFQLPFIASTANAIIRLTSASIWNCLNPIQPAVFVPQPDSAQNLKKIDCYKKKIHLLQRNSCHFWELLNLHHIYSRTCVCNTNPFYFECYLYQGVFFRWTVIFQQY